MKKFLFVFLLIVCLQHSQSFGDSLNEDFDDTMLMFVGEDLPLVTVASRRPESPAAAPAIVSVVERSEIESRGFETLGQLLASEPGFYIAEAARGSVPYLRGISNGVLILYDGVPISLDLTKNLHPLDHELSLHNIKRVEIIRGPSSVLWGADAFAGIVNIVPLTGKDFSGLQSKIFSGYDDMKGAYTSWGGSGIGWDAFVSAYGAKDKYHEKSFSAYRNVDSPFSETTLLQGDISNSEYFEMTGNFNISDWLYVSSRFSDFKKRYTMTDTEDSSWPGERESPVTYIKADITKIIGPSHWTLSTYYEDIVYRLSDVSYIREQKNKLYYGELLWDRRIWEKGIITAGISFKANYAKGAVIKDNFYPDNIYLSSRPSIMQKDYDNNLKSIFTQYRHTLKNMDWWIGARLDDHSQYKTTISYNCGFNWIFTKEWRIKAGYGTAYRTPYSSQIFGNTSFEPEKISTLNLQTSWQPSHKTNLSLTFFYSTLSDYIEEDPYANYGISAPSDQKCTGVEFSAKAKLINALDLFLNITALNAWGGSQKYQSNKIYTYTTPGVPNKEYYNLWEESLDTGADFITTFGFTCAFLPKISLTMDAKISNSVEYSFAQDTESGSFTQPPIVNMMFNIKEFPIKESDIKIGAKNMFDRKYQIPGLYGPVDGKPFSLYLEWSFKYW